MRAQTGRPSHAATTTVSLLALLIAVALLAGCGFHLQGTNALPADGRKIYVSTSDELTPFAVELRRAVERSGGEIVATSGAADIVVRVLYDSTGRRVLSVSARNTPQEYEVYYNVQYSVDRRGREIVEPQPLELIRNLSFDETQVLAKDREEVILREAMARDLASLVMRRLETL
jgi:LPS-assembly lipoprotein